MRVTKYIPFVVILILSVSCVAIWSAVYADSRPQYLTFAVLNVGQGDALFIESTSGTQVLIDGGPDASVLNELSNVMPMFDRSLDIVIETHPDADHIAGLVKVLENYDIGEFIEPGIEKHTATNDALEKEVVDDHIPRSIARAGMSIDLGEGASLQILSPDSDVTHIDPDKDNDGGIVARLIYGDTSVLLTADTSSVVEEHLLHEGVSLQSTILKVGHHGSKTSTENAFIVAVHPNLAVISVGKNNPYGHPTKAVLDRLSFEGIPILRTDTDGRLVFESDGTQFWREN